MIATPETMYKVYQKILKETWDNSRHTYVKRFCYDDYTRQVTQVEKLITLLQKHKMVLEAKGNYDSVPERGLVYLDTKLYY